jgi:hypothetical protein
MKMKSTPTLRFPVQRLFLLTLVSFVAVAALLGIAASANKANRAARARADQAANAKSANNPIVQSDKQPLAPAAASITATLTDNLPAATKVVPGGTINYTAVITNGGVVSPADDATSVQYNATIDTNTSFVGGSAHASPLAFKDSFTTVGNTLLEAGLAVPSGNPSVISAVKLFDNDTISTAPDTIQLASFTAASTNGGTVAVNADGSFSYLPPVGFTGSDTFTYTIRNNTDATLTDTGTVTVAVGAPRVWYVNNSGPNGDGRSSSPFNTLAGADAVDAANDIIYIFTGGGNYTGGVTLQAGEQVIGNGVALVVNTFTLRAAGSRPTVVNAGGNGFTLGSNNTLGGFNFGNCSGFAMQGAAVGTLTVSTMLINSTGGALDITAGGSAVSVVLDSTTSSGGTKNVNIVTANGTVTLGSGALSGASGNAFDVSGAGNAVITYSGTIGNTTARSVTVANKNSGSVSLSGAVSGSGTGISLTSNTGSTINFTGGISLSTAANAAFTATGGGTINATQNNTTIVNTLTTTTGTALQVSNTTIGASGLTFRSITSNGAGGANNGIILDTTGSTAGLTVSGNGGTCTSAATCTGGAIATKTTGANGSTTQGTGIFLNSTSGVSLDRMQLNDFSNYGIFGSSVTGFSLTNSNISGANGNNNAGGVEETSIRFNNLFTSGGFPTAQINNNSIGGGATENIRVMQTSGTLNRLQVNNNTFGLISAAIGNDNFHMEGTGSTTANVTLTGNTFAGTRGDFIETIANTNAIMDTVVRTNKFTNGQAIIPGGGTSVSVRGDSLGTAATVTFDISCNRLVGGYDTVGMFVAKGNGSGTFSGAIVNNVLGAATAGSNADGMFVRAAGTNTMSVLIQNNVITGYTSAGLHLQNNDGSSTMNATIFGNSVTPGAGFPFSGLFLDNGATATDTNQMNVVVGSAGTAAQKNDFSLGDPSNFSDISINNNFAGTTLRLSRNGSASGTATLVLKDDNLNPGTTTVSEAGVITLVNTLPTVPATPAACAVPPIPNRDGNEAVSFGRIEGVPAMQNAPFTPSASLPVATQQLPTTNQSAVATDKTATSDARLSHHAVRSNFNAGQSPNAPLANLPVTIGTLPAAKSVTIKYQVLVSSTAPTARQVSSQGTVTGNGPGAINVTTTDPGPPVVSGPTVTLIDTSITWTGNVDTNWNIPGNWNLPGPVVSTYAPGVSNPAINEVTIPAVATKPTISGSDIGVYSLSLANTMTLTITNPRVLTIGGSPGGDLTLNGIISGGFLNLGTGTHIITNSSATGSISATNVTTVLSGSTVTLANSLQMGALGVNAGGIMNITNQTLSLNGSGAALTVPGGATFTTTGSTVVFNGTAAQQAAGIAYNNLTINNTIGTNVTGVTLTGNATVNGALALTSSDLNTGGFTLTQPNTTPSTGVSDVVGTVTRTGGPFALATPLTFGNPNNIITFTVGTQRPTTLTVLLAKTAPATYAAAVTRNYTISLTGTNNSTSTLRLRYLDPSELNGNVEAQLNLRRLRTSDSHWVAQLPTNRDTVNNWVESNAVLPADLPTQWTFSSLAPTGTDGVVTGRIVDQNGNPVEGAVVRLAGTQDRKFITDANGVYRFDNVETNGLYTVTPARVNYTFNPSSRSFSLVGETTEAAFGATATGQIANPLDTPEYFVRQHYIDFLGREPDEAGFNFWSDQILECGTDNTCIDRRRENVSAAYFLSTEFQQTGGLVDSLYKASYGAHPEFAQFMPDTRTVGLGVVVGREGWQAKLLANKQAFIDAFVNRAAFHAAYDGLSSSDYVDALISHTGVSFTAAERDELLSGLGTGTMTRADVLRSIAENNRFVSAKFNEAFVMMEYFGYLRRDADSSGFAFWLNKLNQFDGNFERADMVKAFIVAGEYRDRFPR